MLCFHDFFLFGYSFIFPLLKFKIWNLTDTHMDFPSGSGEKNMPAMQETGVQSRGRENYQEEGMATHSSILA